MRELKIPKTKEVLNQMKEISEFNLKEELYWKDMIKRRDAQFNEKDYQDKIGFYLQELQATEGKFGSRIAVERRLKYMIGHAHEWLGTYGLEGHAPKERAEMFEKAILWYQSADETLGFYSDYSLRQVESCWGAARFRKQAGLEDEITKAFAERGDYLVAIFLGGLSGENVQISVLNSPVPDYLKKMADEKIESCATAYLFRNDPKSIN